jgi:hypothetical protein
MNTMYSRSFLFLAALSLSLLTLGSFTIACANDYRVSGPISHENLTVYFIQGDSIPGSVPLTLAEALSATNVRVSETGSVNELAIENLGDREIFVQAGDIVKGGQQDRVLSVSLVLPPNEGSIPIAAFCVEQGRWSKRGYEDSRQFSSSAAFLPSHGTRAAIQAVPSETHPAAQLSGRQHEVWQDVARVQRLLSERIGAPVASLQSSTSLQLALENEKLKKAQDEYIAALKPAGERERDIVGYAFAINGKLENADIYPSNALFGKMWAKLLTANATEAIAANNGPVATAPSSADVSAFLEAAETGTASKRSLTKSVELEIRTIDSALYLETRRRDGTWVHRSYVAK